MPRRGSRVRISSSAPAVTPAGPLPADFIPEAPPLAATLKVLDPTQVELEIAVSSDEFAKAEDQAFRRLVKTARFPGFRPGKVPRKIFEAQYGGTLRSEAIDALVPRAYAQAVEEHAIEPVAQPQMELLEESEEAPLRFRAVVPVRPQIELRDYRGIEIAGERDTATDDEVDEAMASLRRDAATLVPVDRELRIGDVATIDYEGKIDGVSFEGGTAKGEQTEIRAERFIPGFADGMVGMRAGETREVHAHFPEEYGERNLAGKDATFTITVHEIKEAELPALDDEFARRVSQSADLLTLRMDVRKRLDNIAKQKARRELVARLLDRLVEMHDVPVPSVMVEAEVESLLNDSRAYVGRHGSTWDDYLAMIGKSDETMREEFRVEAERRVKTSLLVAAIARAEKIEATPQDVDAEIDALAAQYGQPREKILEMMRPNLSSLIDGIVRTKTIDLLLDAAKVGPAATKEASAES